MTARTGPVRHRPEGFEYRCPACAEWWPLTLEFWMPREGMKRCKACIYEARSGRWRERVARIRSNPIAFARFRRINRDAQRRRRAA